MRQTGATNFNHEETKNTKIFPSPFVFFVSPWLYTALGLGNSDRFADHQAAGDEEERDRRVKTEAEKTGGVKIAPMEKKQEQSERNNAGGDRRSLEIFDLACL